MNNFLSLGECDPNYLEHLLSRHCSVVIYIRVVNNALYQIESDFIRYDRIMFIVRV